MVAYAPFSQSWLSLKKAGEFLRRKPCPGHTRGVSRMHQRHLHACGRAVSLEGSRHHRVSLGW
jgi:hypothetical protein